MKFYSPFSSISYAETGAAVGKPLVGHTDCVLSVAYSPDGQHTTSGSLDKTIRIWDAETGATVGKPLKGMLGPCCPLLTLLMGSTSSPDLVTIAFESGMQRCALIYIYGTHVLLL